MAVPAPLHPETLTVLDACAGVGMLGVAVELAASCIGRHAETVCVVERDTCAAVSFVDRMEAQAMGAAPVWDDLATFDGRRFRGCVDIFTAGLPCPAYSSAGKKGGNADPRAWGEDFDPDKLETWGPVPHALRVIAECNPVAVFLENVPQWVRGGFYEPMGRELHRMGFTLQEAVYCPASAVGAAHHRDRVFVLGVNPRHERAGLLLADPRRPGHEQRLRPREARGADGAAEDGARQRQRGGADDRSGGGGMAPCEFCGNPFDHDLLGRYGCPNCEGAGLADAGSEGREGGERRGALCGQGPAAPGPTAQRGGDLAIFTPGQGDPDNPHHPDFAAWAAVAAVDTSRLPRVEPELSVVAHGMAPAPSDLLRIGGNGVVPVAGAIAFVHALAGVRERFVREVSP